MESRDHPAYCQVMEEETDGKPWYHTSIHILTGETPFSLVYGIEVVLPIEVEILSLRVLMEAKLEESEWVYEKKISHREFWEGDLVLKKILPIQKDYRGKWTPNYEGPYVVKKAFSGGALILTNMDGKDLVFPVNSDAVNKYHA
ncbi:uncharacterized protein [Cicer arietinum]|uniref:uncharacterized protein n=1 Tax=Cicer arietinum TaxID=3827 RepID=UPI003CC64039